MDLGRDRQPAGQRAETALDAWQVLVQRAAATPAASARILARRLGDQRARWTMAGTEPGGSLPRAGQAKLAVNTPGDAYEQEADRAADAVMGGAPPGVAGRGGGVALRRCACGGTCAACRGEEELRREDAGGSPRFAPPIVHDVLASPGRPLEGGTRAYMEGGFGADFGEVRVHTDARAANSARAVNANAYTVGRDVVFAAGSYAPGTRRGDRLIAHELAHTLQQEHRVVQRQAAVELGVCTVEPEDDEREEDELGRVHLTSTRGNSATSTRWMKTDGSETTYSETFDEKVAAELKKAFGADVTHDAVLEMIRKARAEGKHEIAEEYRKKLFRANEYAVVETLDVEQKTKSGQAEGKNALGRTFTSSSNHPLYGRTKTEKGKQTYCNVYAYDVVTAMGAYLPRVWWTDEYEKKAIEAMNKGEPFTETPKYGKNVTEMNANQLNGWFSRVGSHFSWEMAASMEDAQQAANQGNVVVLVAAHKSAGHSGHIAVILPERDQLTATREDGKVDIPLTSQAGLTNWKATAGKKKWWTDEKHEGGAAWIHKGAIDSPVVTPEQMGVEETLDAVEPVTTAQVSPAEEIQGQYAKFAKGEIGMPALARAVKPFASSPGDEILVMIDRLAWDAKDNFCFALASNSSDAELQGFSLPLLQRMSEELSTLLTLSWSEHAVQKQRVDATMSVPSVGKGASARE